MKSNRSIMVTLWVVRFFMIVLGVLLFLAPWLTTLYINFRHMAQIHRIVILSAFYCCTPPAGIALWSMNQLLKSFLRGEVFTRSNVSLVRRVSVCCAAVALITLAAGFGYPPLFFVAVLMAVLFLCVLVVANLLEAAAVIREENDLTI